MTCKTTHTRWDFRFSSDIVVVVVWCDGVILPGGGDGVVPKKEVNLEKVFSFFTFCMEIRATIKEFRCLVNSEFDEMEWHLALFN